MNRPWFCRHSPSSYGLPLLRPLLVTATCHRYHRQLFSKVRADVDFTKPSEDYGARVDALPGGPPAGTSRPCPTPAYRASPLGRQTGRRDRFFILLSRSAQARCPGHCAHRTGTGRPASARFRRRPGHPCRLRTHADRAGPSGTGIGISRCVCPPSWPYPTHRDTVHPLA